MTSYRPKTSNVCTYIRCYVQHTYLVLINLSLTISAAASYDEVGIDEIEIERVVEPNALPRYFVQVSTSTFDEK